MLQFQGVAQRAGLGENVVRELPQPAGPDRAAFAESNHPGNERGGSRRRKSICAALAPPYRDGVESPVHSPPNWTDELVRFLCEHPGVGAVRLDPAAHKVSVATLGQVDLRDLESRLADTIAAVEAKFADQPARLA